MSSGRLRLKKREDKELAKAIAASLLDCAAPATGLQDGPAASSEPAGREYEHLLQPDEGGGAKVRTSHFLNSNSIILFYATHSPFRFIEVLQIFWLPNAASLGPFRRGSIC